jgi:glutaredoxin-like YruB-family protein
MEQIQSYSELQKILQKGSGKTFLLLYKSGSESSECALTNFEKSLNKLNRNDMAICADVSRVRDIHARFSITTAPALLEFTGQELKGTVKGCQTADYYSSFFNNSLHISQNKEKKTEKKVVVYSTPTCPHCNSLKSYLKRQKIGFRDIDVSKDQKMAQELVRKSGQQGVPQTEINGKIIVGFNKSKIDELLELN